MRAKGTKDGGADGIADDFGDRCGSCIASGSSAGRIAHSLRAGGSVDYRQEEGKESSRRLHFRLISSLDCSWFQFSFDLIGLGQ